MIPSREGGDQLCYSTILTFAQLAERNREFGRFDMGKTDCDERRDDRDEVPFWASAPLGDLVKVAEQVRRVAIHARCPAAFKFVRS